MHSFIVLGPVMDMKLQHCTQFEGTVESDKGRCEEGTRLFTAGLLGVFVDSSETQRKKNRHDPKLQLPSWHETKHSVYLTPSK